MAPRVTERRDVCTRELQYGTKPVETEKDRRGWWFSAQDVYHNANMGRISADLFSEALDEACTLKQYSREDLKLYYADKKEVLTAKLNITGKKLDQAILALSPVSIGREIGAKKVVVGHITDSEMRHNHVSGHFNSVASFDIAVYDVRSGKVEFEQCYSMENDHGSQYTLYEKAAKDFAAHYTDQGGVPVASSN
jgi:hypothetical protein